MSRARSLSQFNRSFAYLYRNHPNNTVKLKTIFGERTGHHSNPNGYAETDYDSYDSYFDSYSSPADPAKEEKSIVDKIKKEIDIRNTLKGDRDDPKVQRIIEYHHKFGFSSEDSVVSYTTKPQVAAERADDHSHYLISDVPDDKVIKVNEIMERKYDGSHDKADLNEAVIINSEKEASKYIKYIVGGGDMLKLFSKPEKGGARCLLTGKHIVIEDNKPREVPEPKSPKFV